MIVSPIDNNRYSIHSVAGRELLKQYIKNYNNGGNLEEFIRKRGLETNPNEWTAPIPPLPMGEMPRPNILDRNTNLGFNRTYNPRPPLAKKIEKKLFKDSENWLRKFYEDLESRRRANMRRLQASRAVPPPLPPLKRSKRKRSHKGSYEELPEHILLTPRKRAKKIKKKIQPKKKIQIHWRKQPRENNLSKLMGYFKSIFGKPSSEDSEDEEIKSYFKDHDTRVQPWEIGLVTETTPVIEPQEVKMDFIQGSAADV